MSPALKHSADMPHSWSGPTIVSGHGPVWQLDVMLAAPQQTWPGKQPAEDLHMMPLPNGPLLASTPSLKGGAP
jgi:hypothetical protein